MQSIEAVKMRTAILNAMDEQIAEAHDRMIKAEDEFLNPPLKPGASANARLWYHEAIAAYSALRRAKEYLVRAGV